MKRFKLIKVLERVSGQIREFENRADHELHEHGNPEAAVGLMRKKAELLTELPRIVAPYLNELKEDERAVVEDRIEGFAANARRSLDIGSVFFMANLLYDADHAPGALNNLEILNRNVAECLADSISAESD